MISWPDTKMRRLILVSYEHIIMTSSNDPKKISLRMAKNKSHYDIVARYKNEAPYFSIIRTYHFDIIQRPKKDKQRTPKNRSHYDIVAQYKNEAPNFSIIRTHHFDIIQRLKKDKP